MGKSGNRRLAGRGGRRSGAGRKAGSRETLSVRHVREFRKVAQARADFEGRALADIVLEIVYDPCESVRNRLAAIKLYWDKMLTKVVEGNETDRVLGPTIYLPEHLPEVVETDSRSAN